MRSRASILGYGDSDDDDPLFVEDGQPVRFCFHKSVTQGQSHIARDVERHGGQIVATERQARVLLIDEQLDIGQFRRRYAASPEYHRQGLYVEKRTFVRACIRTGTYRHVEPAKRKTPGPARLTGPGQPRVPFTEEDRNRLAYYLATRLPERPGRMGNSVYKELEALGRTEAPDWEWARRHTFHSWREHYKQNPDMMDVKINFYLRQMEAAACRRERVRREAANARREEEEDEEEEEREEEAWARERREREGRQANRAPQEYLARHERNLVAFDDGEVQEEEDEHEEEEEEIEQEQQGSKRHHAHPSTHPQCDTRDAQAKRVRVSDPSSGGASGTEAPRGESPPAHGEQEDSQEIEGSDLFGDREYGSHAAAFDDNLAMDFPAPFSPRVRPMPDRGSPSPTQATLVSSPRYADKELTALVDTPTRAVEAPTPARTGGPPSSQTVVATEERVVVRRARVRGASAQPGPSVSQDVYRYTRARSRSVEPGSQPEPELQGDAGSKSKRKAKERTTEALVSIEEDMQVEEELGKDDEEEELGSGGPATRETFEGDSEMAVQGLLGHAEEDEDGDDEDMVADLDLPPFQDVELEDTPSDSDDAETHGALVRGTVQASGSGEEARSARSESPSQDQDKASEADRVARMAGGTLLQREARASSPPKPRVTRSMTATQSQTAQVSPRRTRSQAAAFPSPGTKARAVVDQFQEEERRVPYTPPAGSRAARAIRGTGRGG